MNLPVTQKHFLSFSRKLFLSVISLFLVFAICFIAYQYQREREYKIELLNTKLQDYNSRLYEQLEEQPLDSEIISGYINKHILEDLRVTLIDAEGNVKAGYKIYKTEASTDEWGVQLPGDIATATEIKNALDVTAEGLMDSTGKEIKAADLKTYFDQNGVYKGGLYSKLSADGGTGKKGDLKEIGADRIDDFVTVTTKTGKKIDALNLSLHVGADGEASNKIDLSIKSMSAQGIGVSDLKVNTADSATAAIETLKNAIQTVSTQRSALGAVQNRLEHTINNLDNVVENTTSAESQIRDTDMATEMVKYSNNNILAQAGQAMLAQANQSNQGVLSLLQ